MNSGRIGQSRVGGGGVARGHHNCQRLPLSAVPNSQWTRPVLGSACAFPKLHLTREQRCVFSGFPSGHLPTSNFAHFLSTLCHPLTHSLPPPAGQPRGIKHLSLRPQAPSPQPWLTLPTGPPGSPDAPRNPSPTCQKLLEDTIK